MLVVLGSASTGFGLRDAMFMCSGMRISGAEGRGNAQRISATSRSLRALASGVSGFRGSVVQGFRRFRVWGFGFGSVELPG